MTSLRVQREHFGAFAVFSRNTLGFWNRAGTFVFPFEYAVVLGREKLVRARKNADILIKTLLPNIRETRFWTYLRFWTHFFVKSKDYWRVFLGMCDIIDLDDTRN